MCELYMDLLTLLGTLIKINRSKATAVFARKATSFYPCLSDTKMPDKKTLKLTRTQFVTWQNRSIKNRI